MTDTLNSIEPAPIYRYISVAVYISYNSPQTVKSDCGVTVSIIACQADDPGSIPSEASMEGYPIFQFTGNFDFRLLAWGNSSIGIGYFDGFMQKGRKWHIFRNGLFCFNSYIGTLRICCENLGWKFEWEVVKKSVWKRRNYRKKLSHAFLFLQKGVSADYKGFNVTIYTCTLSVMCNRLLRLKQSMTYIALLCNVFYLFTESVYKNIDINTIWKCLQITV